MLSSFVWMLDTISADENLAKLEFLEPSVVEIEQIGCRFWENRERLSDWRARMSLVIRFDLRRIIGNGDSWKILTSVPDKDEVQIFPE